MTLVHSYVSSVSESTSSGGVGGNVGPTEWNNDHTLSGVGAAGVLFNSGNSISGDTSFTYTSPGQASLSLGTITSNAHAINITGTLNNAATSFDAPFFMNITGTAYGSNTYLMEVQTGGNRTFAVPIASTGSLDLVQLSISGTSNANGWRLNNTSLGSEWFCEVAGNTGTMGIGTGMLFFDNFSGHRSLILNGGGANQAQALIHSGMCFSWASNTSPNITDMDTNLSRVAAKVVQIGDTARNANGWLNWAGEARVSANSTTTSTALANVPGLAFKPLANRNYSFEAHLIFTDAAAGGIQCAVNATSTTTTYTLTFDGWVTDTTAVRGYAQGSAFGNVVASSLTTGTLGRVTITGTLMTSATPPSTFTVQFAQNTSNATPTTVLIGSYMWTHDMP